ncbi:ATPase [Thiomonas sp. X19]|uniref:ATP-binding protein n=1 Tax=Thiomonas sp. X19 TaxID=1050370 RepID=UPI000B6D5DF5|nr:ATP-binding protein [Thiomonas sp. X19]SCC93025.1 ATPase [Thiomonas sp. X19]
MAEWNFYGRTGELAELRRVVQARRWFFCRIEGRRRIGKTTLLSQLARESQVLASHLVYMQVPDSDERDVAATLRRSLEDSEGALPRALSAAVVDFPSMANAIGQMCRAGFIVVLDEFQYFTRAKLKAFNSFLQAQVDELRNAKLPHGGLFVLGSLQSEMNALLDDKAAPLYGRITAQLKLNHWDFQDLMAVFRGQGLDRPSQWLTLWTFFEGVPKFYHDAYEQDLFSVEAPFFAHELLTRMFVRSSSPLAEEADTWFLRELRGKAVSVLHYLADHAGCSNGELVAALNDPHDATPVTAVIGRLVNNYGMVDRLQPVFSNSKSRNARYYIADNFLQAWLSVAKPTREAARLRPAEKALATAMPRLQTLEGASFEKLIRSLHIEMSRKGLSDFELSELKLGYWNRPRDIANSIEIDLVALDEPNKRVRFGSCKRSEAAHDAASLAGFDKHVADFLQVREHRRLAEWQCERVLFAPEFSADGRQALTQRGYRCLDLTDYAALV